MSETDDTEKLLLVPPDHFIVYTSDSDDSEFHNNDLIDIGKADKDFVETISGKVNRLKTCLEKLENVSITEPFLRNNFIDPKCSQTKYNTLAKQKSILFSNAQPHVIPKISDYLSSHNCVTTFNNYFNPNVCTIFEGPQNTTPVCYKAKTYLPVNLQSRFSVSSFESESASDNSIDSCTLIAPLKMESETDSIFLTPQKKQDSFMLSEIDTFLENICKFENGIHSLDESAYLQTPVYNKWLNTSEKNESFESKDRNKIKECKRPDMAIDPLSKCLNWQKSQKRANLQDDCTNTDYECDQIKISELGSLKSSVPDLGFGMRDIMYPRHDSQSVEEPINKQSSSKITSSSQSQPNTYSETVTADDYKIFQEEFDLREKKARQKFQEPLPDNFIELNKGVKNPCVNVLADQIKVNCNTADNLEKPFIKSHQLKYNSEKVIPKQDVYPKQTAEYKKPKQKTEYPDGIRMANCVNFTTDNDDHPFTKSHQFKYNSQQVNPKRDIYPKRNDVYKKQTEYEKSNQEMENPDRIQMADSVKCTMDNVENTYSASKLNASSVRSQTLPSLGDLWGTSSETKKGNIIDVQRFEEEKLRRGHCEEIIQQLQKKLLEQQQKLAIAVQVDRDKDDALLKLRNALVSMTDKISHIKNAHLQQIENVHLNLKSVIQENEELKKSTDRHKCDMSKALQFAQDCQEKCRVAFTENDRSITVLKADINKYKETLKDKDDRFAELKESNNLVVQLNRQMSENLSNLQTNINKIKEDHSLVKEELNSCKKTCGSLEDEMIILKNERNDLRLIISEEKSRNSHLDTQKTKLQTLLDASNKKMKSLELEFATFKRQTDEQKNELKTYYQNQVENIVMGKMNEFQNQLNSAENLMSVEMQHKEKEIAVQFAKQLHKVEQQHILEVGLLEEKHKEEIKLYRIQLAQSSQTIQRLEDKLTSYKNRRGLIAAQLHSVMENQWQQALKIITNGATTSDNNRIQEDTDSQSSVIGLQQMISNSISKHPDPNVLNGVKSNNHCFNNGDREFSKNFEHFEKPSKIQSNRVASATNNPGGDGQLNEEDVQRYVKLLLQKTPGITDAEDIAPTSEGMKLHKHMEHQNSFRQGEDEYPTSDKNFEQYDRKIDRNSQIKPPWK